MIIFLKPTEHIWLKDVLFVNIVIVGHERTPLRHHEYILQVKSIISPKDFSLEECSEVLEDIPVPTPLHRRHDIMA